MKTILITIAAVTAAVSLAPGQAPAQNPANTVTLAASPTLITFGGQTALSGQVTGADNAGVKVDLQEDPFPFGEYKNSGLSVSTDASGNYTFTAKPTLLTRYRVNAKAKPSIESPHVDVRVRSLVALAVNDRTAKRGQRITFSGTVTPAHAGTVRLQRRIGTGSFRTIASPALVAGAVNSTFTHTVRVRRTAVYRVRTVADADHVRGTSPKRRVRVG
jgi:hypothetical protein